MCNVGKTDKIIRALLGLGLIVGAFVMGNIVMGVVGLVLAGTAALNFCPIYAVLKLNTGCKKNLN